MILTVTLSQRFTCVIVKVFFYHEETLEKATSLMVTGQLDNVRILRLIF